MHEGKLLQIGTPEDIYERPSTRFVADFIGRSNFLEATVASENEVVLSNGDRLQLESDHAIGESVAITVRPERLTIHKKGESSSNQHQIDGAIDSVVYLGNAIVYSVSIDWMHLEVRSSETSNSRYSEGDEVTVSFDPKYVSVVSG